MQQLVIFRKYVYDHFLKPSATDPDARRQEYILNILLLGLAVCAVIDFIISTKSRLSDNIVHNPSAYSTSIIFSGLIGGLILLSRRGHSRWAASIFMAVLSLVGFQLLFAYGFMLPTASLAFALIIVVAGVLLGAFAGLIFSGILSVIMFVVAYGQLHGQLHPDTDWLRAPFYSGDAVGYITIFLLIGLVSWLSNREIHHSLRRARASEAALAVERDSLEVKVAERTSELEATQLIRLMELRRFAEFGRLSANLLHEVASPLTAASLHLDQVDQNQYSKQVRQARKNLRQLERYIEAARQHIRGSSQPRLFTIRTELKQIMRIIEPRLQRDQIIVEITQPASYKLYGDVVRFNQLICNLLINAIDAYQGQPAPPNGKRIDLSFFSDGPQLHCRIEDYGPGMTARQLSQIFEPFFTTKDHGRGMGIGLAMVKQFVEQDFGGQIEVSSTLGQGSRFDLTLIGLRPAKTKTKTKAKAVSP